VEAIGNLLIPIYGRCFVKMKTELSGTVRSQGEDALILRFDDDFLSHGAPDELILSFDGHYEQAVEGTCLDNLHGHAGKQAALLQQVEQVAVLVADVIDLGGIAFPEVCQRAGGKVVDRAVPIGDGMTVRIAARVAEHFFNARLKPLGDVVLQNLGLLVNLVPRKAHHLFEV
jgi:hypothetical protein